MFASPGPIYEPESARADYWRFARALYAAGFRAGELAYNCFSYHFTPAGSMMETAAHAVGCTVFPGGTGQTEQQVRAIADLAPSGYTGTPSFLKIIWKSRRTRRAAGLAAARAGLGRAFPPSLRDWLAARGIEGYQAYGSADLGMIAFERRRARGWCWARTSSSRSCVPAPATRARRRGRRSGGDHAEPGLSAGALRHGRPVGVLPGVSPCGRTNTRIRGWMGRADQTTKVRGMFVHPSQVADAAPPSGNPARAPGHQRHHRRRPHGAQDRVARGEDLAKRIADSLRDDQLRGDVEWVDAGGLPNDGKVIDDVRTYEYARGGRGRPRTPQPASPLSP